MSSSAMGRPKGSKNSPNKKKRIHDPNRPKRPTSAYFYFIAEKRCELKAEGKHISKVAEWTKEISKYWRALLPEEKKPFEKLAATDKIRYDEAMAIYKGVDTNKPKRAQSAYFLWLADFRQRMRGKFAENKDLLRAAGEDWKSLNDEEKGPYEKKAEIERKRYAHEMSEYNANGVQNKPAPLPVPAKVPRYNDTTNGKSEGESDDEDDDDDDDDEDEESE